MPPSESLSLPAAVTDLMARTIDRLRQLKVQPDPIVPAYLLRPFNILNSAIRSDGHILEAMLFEALNSAPHLQVVRTPHIYIPAMVDQLVGGGASDEALRNSDLFYQHEVGRRISPDLLIIDPNRQAIDFLEVKRGLGKTDAGKTRQTTRDLRCLRLIAKNYAKSQMNLDIATATAGVCAIHGATTVPLDLQVGVDELEARYQTDIRKFITATHHEFGRLLSDLLFEQALEDDLPNLLSGLEIINPTPDILN